MQAKQMWYSNNTDKTTPDFIHQTLMYGTLKEINELRELLGEIKMEEIFLYHPKKVYTKAALNFIAHFVLRIHSPIDEQLYLKNTSRYIGH